MEITAEIIQAFRDYGLFNGQFSDTVKYPDDLIEAALCIADGETGGSGWGSYEDDCHNFKQKGMFLYAACWLIYSYKDTTANGGVIVGNPGQVTSKSVRDESISFATYTPKNQSEAANSWLLSIAPWGQMFISLRRRAYRGARAL